MLSFGGNKLRVYIAYFPHVDWDSFHTALYVVPKNPKGGKDSWRFDIHDILVNIAGRGVVQWSYSFKMGTERREILDRPGQPVDYRSKRLLAMLLIGKLKSSVSIDELRNFLHASVDISAHDAADKSWRCQHWVMEVVDQMNAAGLLSPPLDLPCVNIWNNGRVFAERLRAAGFRYNAALPVCDTAGQPIDSEIPPAPFLLGDDPQE